MKELFEKEAPRQVRRTRHQLYQHIDADYYGFRDEEDGVLEKVEAVAEKMLRAQVGDHQITALLQLISWNPCKSSGTRQGKERNLPALSQPQQTSCGVWAS